MAKCVIINQGFAREARYQIMFRAGSGYIHARPGKLYTLANAKAECAAQGWIVAAIGDIWQCLGR